MTDLKDNKDIKSSDEYWGEADDSARRPRVKTLPVTKENRLIYLIGVTALSFIAVGAVIFIGICGYQGKSAPEALNSLGSVSLGAIASLFISRH